MAVDMVSFTSQGPSQHGDSACFLLDTLMCTPLLAKEVARLSVVDTMTLLPVGNLLQVYELVLAHSLSYQQTVT